MAVFLLSFLEVFGQVDDLLAEGVKLPRGFVEVIELTGQAAFGKVDVDGLNDLVVVVSDADKLVVKTAEAGVIIVRGPVCFDHVKRSSEQSEKDKTGGLSVHSGLVHHLQKAGVLLGVELERIAVDFRIEGFGTARFFAGHGMRF